MAKRTYAPRSRSVSKKAKIYRAPSTKKFLLGNTITTTLKYVEFISLNPGVAGVPASYVYSANGCYDPNITGVGHQPRGFDQLIALYDHFKVISSTIKCSFSQRTSSTAPNDWVVGVQLQDDSIVAADMIQAMEGRYTKYAVLQTGGESKTVFNSFNSKSFFQIDDRLTYGDITQNPGDQAYYVVYAQPPVSADNNPTNVVVEIQYTVKFTEPNNVAAS